MKLQLKYKISMLVILAAMLTACEGPSRLPFEVGVGANPQLPPPTTALIPTIKVAKVVGWSATAMPLAPPGFQVTALARDLDHPRWLYTMPNGDILVVESNKPPKPADVDKGFFARLRGKVQSMAMKRAGANPPSANRITLIRGVSPDGTAKHRTVFMKDLMSPFALALVGDELYIANADAIIKVSYTDALL